MFKILTRTLFLFLFFLYGHAWAANYSDPIVGVFRGIYGDTITVEVPSLVSKSPVAGQNQIGELSFQFNPSTSYSNFYQLTDLKNGDPVRVKYTEANGNDKHMVAQMITKLNTEVGVSPMNIANGSETNSSPVVTQQTVTTTTTRVDNQ